MKKEASSSIIAAFVWIGFVCAISFMEAWLKFRAPGITIGLGLGIGKLVFSALNKVEWLLAIIIIIEFVSNKGKESKVAYTSFMIVIAILILQTVWLLPALNERAMLVINNANPGKSSLHYVFVAAEVLKVITLFIFGNSQLKNKFYEHHNTGDLVNQ